MELVKNIFFNTDKIVENTEVKVTYAGTLFQNGSDSVNVHYGFGTNWDNAKDIPMEKTDLGFQANIVITSGDTLNMCFNNSNGEWDNNYGSNYGFTVVKSESAGWNNDGTTTETINEYNNNTTPSTEESAIAVRTTPSWGDLFKKTFSNIKNYFSKIFGKGTGNVSNNSNV